MDPRNLEKQREPEEPRFLSFPHVPEDTKREDGTQVLNRWSSTLTTGHNFPGAQVSSTRSCSVECIIANMHTTQGYAVRRRCPQQGSHEDVPASWHCQCVVGGQPLQVSLPHGCGVTLLTVVQHAL